LCVGTGVFFVSALFQKIGAGFFMIPDESIYIWRQILFYLALSSYFLGFKGLVSLGSAESSTKGGVLGEDKTWGVFALIVLIVLLVIPSMAEPAVHAYASSLFATYGLHHFIGFLFAGIVGSYVLKAKKNFGQIGRAVANPMIVAIWVLAAQNMWELYTESWRVLHVTSSQIEGVGNIFLTIAALAIVYAALSLKAATELK
jgi:hypothetical protein